MFICGARQNLRWIDGCPAGAEDQTPCGGFALADRGFYWHWRVMLSRIPRPPRTFPVGFIAPCLPTSAPQPPSGALWLHDIACRAVSPAAIVSIGSTVKFIDDNATNIRQVKLVLPDEANDVDLISVTGALDSALIGLGPGQTRSWHDGHTERRTTVLETSKN